MRARENGFELKVLVGRDGGQTEQVRIAVPVRHGLSRFRELEGRSVQLLYPGNCLPVQILEDLGLSLRNHLVVIPHLGGLFHAGPLLVHEFQEGGLAFCCKFLYLLCEICTHIIEEALYYGVGYSF